MKPRDDPLSLNADTNNNGDLKCCNCEADLAPENQVTHIPSYLSKTPGELIKIRDALLIVFEGDIRAKGFTFDEKEYVAMCAECTPSFIDMYNAYAKFMGMTTRSSWLKETIKESVIWTDKKDWDEEEERPQISPKNTTDADQGVSYQFEKVKLEPTPETNNVSKKRAREPDDEETVIVPDLRSSSPTPMPSSSISGKIYNYTEKFAVITLDRLTERELKTAGNHISFSQIKNETEHVKVEMDIGVKDLIKSENQEMEVDDNYSSPKIIGLQSSTISTSDSSKFYSVHRCPMCQRNFSDEKAMITHYDAVHKNPTQQFTCQLCNEKFSVEWFYKHHIEKFHDGIELTFSCQICLEGFSNAKELDEHKESFHIDVI